VPKEQGRQQLPENLLPFDQRAMCSPSKLAQLVAILKKV